MLEHLAMWHMLGNEEEVASWLLWEHTSMMVHPIGNVATVDAMKNNIIFQLMVNKFFDAKVGKLDVFRFPDRGEYGQGKAAHGL